MWWLWLAEVIYLMNREVDHLQAYFEFYTIFCVLLLCVIVVLVKSLLEAAATRARSVQNLPIGSQRMV